ncbi:MAG: hypothetical protein AAFU71_16705 [Cyanobacteria bacterium J06632_22]
MTRNTMTRNTMTRNTMTGNTKMNHNASLHAGAIVASTAGRVYRVLEVTEHSVSLIRVNGQTVFAYRPEIAAALFSAVSDPQPS